MTGAFSAGEINCNTNFLAIGKSYEDLKFSTAISPQLLSQ